MRLLLFYFLAILPSFFYGQIDKTQFLKTTDGCKVFIPHINSEYHHSIEWDGNKTCQNGFLNGKGTCTLKIENEKVGSLDALFIDGIPTGKCVYKYLSKTIEIELLNGKISGIGRIVTNDGDVYQGEIINSLAHGNGHIKYSNGTEFIGKFNKDVFYSGKYIDLKEDTVFFYKMELVESLPPQNSSYPVLNEVITEYFDENWTPCLKKDAVYFRKIKYIDKHQADGEVRDYFINGSLYSVYTADFIDYHDDDLTFHGQGKLKLYYKSGSLLSEFNVNDIGKIQGVYKNYHENGSLSVKSHFNYFGLRDGEYVELDEYGNISKFCLYEDDELSVTNNYKYYIINDDMWKNIYSEDFERNESFWKEGNEDLVSLFYDGILVNNNKKSSFIKAKQLVIDRNMQPTLFLDISLFKENLKSKFFAGLVFDYVNKFNYSKFIIDHKRNVYVKVVKDGKENTLIKVKLNDIENEQKDILSYTFMINFWNQSVDFILNDQTVLSMDNWNWRSSGNFGLIAENVNDMYFRNFGSIEYENTEISEKLSLYVFNNILPDNKSEFDGSGTGFFLNEQGYLVTNYHVIENSKEIYIQLNGKEEKYSAEVIITDKINDLAILKINEKIELGKLPYSLDFNLQDVGTSIYTLGYPLLDVMGNEIKFSDGKISSKTGIDGDLRTYQISAPVQPGNSGGPLFNSETGKVVGIVSSTLNRETFNSENVNYALKSSLLKNLIESSSEKINISTLKNEKNNQAELKTQIDSYKLFIPIILIKN